MFRESGWEMQVVLFGRSPAVANNSELWDESYACRRSFLIYRYIGKASPLSELSMYDRI